LDVIVRENILLALKEAFLSRRSLENLPEGIWKRTSALNTWGTNAIEGNTLTWKDVEKLLLLEKNVPNRPLRDVLETIQHEAAFRSLLARKDRPVTLVTALELHEAVFKGARAIDPGQWRLVNVRIAGSEHRPPRPEKVVAEMDKWRAEYARRDLVGEEVFELGAWMHHVFESIHPFADGNGRVGRLLLNLHFMKHNWAPVHLVPGDRDEYLAALEGAQGGDQSALVHLLQEAMARSLLDLLDQVGTEQDELKALWSFGSKSGYSSNYLALRANQGELPAVKERGRWRTSARAMALYREHAARA
jgi:Fic family protein